MSWFDATSLTSYAKTALASAQKSIDKVLDIEDGKTDASQNVKDKEESTASASSSSQKKSGLKLQASNSQAKSNTSTHKDSSKADFSIDGGGDFWSSFLGSSPAASSTPSPADKKPKKTSLSSKQIDLNAEQEPTDNQEKTLEKRRKRRENRMGISSKNENQKKVSSREDDRKKREKEISNTMESVNSSDSEPGHEIQTETFYGDSNSSMQQSLNQSSVSEDSTTSIDALDKRAKDERVSPTTDKPKLSLATENNLGNERESSKQIGDKFEDEDQGDSTCESQNVGTKNKDCDAEDIRGVNDDDSEVSLVPTSERSEDHMVNEDSINIDPVSNNIESLLHAVAVTATSTPFAENKRTTMGLTGEEHDSSILEDDNDRSRKNKSLVVETKKSEKQEEEESVGKEPVEDDCTDEEVIIGSMYKVDETQPDEEEHLTESRDNEMVIPEGNNVKILKVLEPTVSCSTTDEVDPDENTTNFTGEMEDAKDSIKKGEEETDLSQHCSEIETLIAQENEREGVKSSELKSLLKEVSSLKELVNARESKMVALSKENIDLHETNTILRSQLEQLENVHQEGDEEFQEMREEFTTRMAAAENKFHEVAKERDELKKELEETTEHLTAINERQREELTTLLSEKDEQIAQLLTEGEKLSKQELQSNTIIRKLRSKEKENDTLIKKQTKKLEEYENEVKRLTEILTSRDDSNSKQGDAIIKLNAYVKKQEEQLSKQTSELEDANEKVRSMQVALDNAYKEMMTLQKQAASSDSSIQEAVLSTEMKAKEELRIALEKTRREYGQDSELMALQISDLQTSLSRTEKQFNRREESLREEIKDLQQRLQEAEDRNQELAASVSHATRPLLRQIENLQATHSGQASTWEMVEKNLTQRLNEAQSQLLSAQEKERLASQNVSELNSRISRLESQVNSYRTERARLEAELELERTKTGSLEDTHSREAAKSDAMLKKYKKIIEDANQDKAHLEQQLAVEKSRLETELKKVKATLESKEKLLSRQSSLSSLPPSSPSAYSETKQDDEVTQHKTLSRQTSSSSSVVDGIARGILGGTTELVERLQAQIRQKDGEIKLLQDEVTSLRQSRDSVMEELTKMTNELHELETSHEQLTLLKAKYDELQQRYNAVLQMYGEKEEEAEELRMDLQDVKSMYKQQLEQLFGSSR